MASTVTYESRQGPNFSEKIENFFRTTENFYETTGSKPGSRMFSNRLAGLIRDSYELYVEVPSYKPDEVSVTTSDELIIISGKHEETHPEFGFQSREFTHKYTLPKNIDKGKMTCVFKERGYLKIEAPFIKPEEPNSRQIPIKIVSEPAVSLPATSKSASVSSVSNGTSVSHV